jgi:hypothetical protein
MMLALLLKGLILGVGYPDFLVVTSILAFEGYKLHLKSKAPDPVRLNAEVQSKLDAINNKISSMNMQQTVKKTSETRFF